MRLLDIADEQVRHGFGSVQFGTRPGEVEEHRHVVVGVDTGRHNDVQLGGRRDALDAGNVAAQPDNREIDDAVHAAGLQFVQPRDRVGHPLLLVTPNLGIVLQNLGREDEDVLVHQGDAEI